MPVLATCMWDSYSAPEIYFSSAHAFLSSLNCTLVTHSICLCPTVCVCVCVCVCSYGEFVFLFFFFFFIFLSFFPARILALLICTWINVRKGKVTMSVFASPSSPCRWKCVMKLLSCPILLLMPFRSRDASDASEIHLLVQRKARENRICCLLLTI